MMNSQAVNLESLPSVYATQPSARVSERYGFIPTSAVVHALEREGFTAVQARAARASPERVAFARHLIRFRHRDHLEASVGDWLPEVVLVNSHDGNSSYRIMAGVFRLVCSNGLVVGNPALETQVRHTRNAPDEIIDASFRVIAALPGITESVHEMRALPLTSHEQKAFATTALSLRYPNEFSINPRQVLNTRRAADNLSDLWTTLNVVQENLLRGGLPRLDSGRRTRRITSVGEDVRLNRALWTLAEETTQHLG